MKKSSDQNSKQDKTPNCYDEFFKKLDEIIAAARAKTSTTDTSKPRKLSPSLAKFIEETDKLPMPLPALSRQRTRRSQKKGNTSEEFLRKIETFFGAKRK